MSLIASPTYPNPYLFRHTKIYHPFSMFYYVGKKKQENEKRQLNFKIQRRKTYYVWFNVCVVEQEHRSADFRCPTLVGSVFMSNSSKLRDLIVF